MNSELGGMTCVPLEWLALFALAKTQPANVPKQSLFTRAGVKNSIPVPTDFSFTV